MRIPPSLIIMSLATATPFGLAIRDTLTKKPVIDEDSSWGALDGRSSRHDREDYERYEAEIAREAAEKAEKRTEAADRFSLLFGTKPATLGALFDGIHLGADSSSFQPEDARVRIERESEKGFISVSFDTDATLLRSIAVTISTNDYDSSANEMCRSLHDKLVTAWGPGTNGSWLDETHRQRVHLSQDPVCELTFDRALPPAEWLAALPMNLIGKSENALDDYATNSAISFEERGDDIARWYIPSMGTADGTTEILAMIEKHKVVGLRVSGVGDFDSIVAVRDALTKQLKVQPKHEGDDDTVSTWKHKPAVRMTLLDDSAVQFDLLVGKDPAE
jgi:hypothetical protein